MLSRGVKSFLLQVSPDGAKNPSTTRANPIGTLAERQAHASSSSNAYSNYYWEAFDGTANKWSVVKPRDGWITWTFDEAIKVNKMAVWAINWAYFRVEASDDMTNWTVLFDYTSGPNLGEGSYVWITWVNGKAFKTYRLYLYSMGNVYMELADIIYVENS